MLGCFVYRSIYSCRVAYTCHNYIKDSAAIAS